QKRLGVIPTNAQLTEWPADLPKWETLSADEKKLFARQAEVYAGYTAYTDYEIGRVIQAVEDMGKVDNTLIIYIDGDNGTSPEATGINAHRTVNGIEQSPIEGVSMAYTFDKMNSDAASARKTQYFEMMSNRGIYNEGWYANTTPPVAPWVLNSAMPDINAYNWE